MLSEEEILLLLAEADSEVKKFRIKANQYRQLFLDSETELIGAKLKKDRLEEDLKYLKIQTEDQD